MSTSPSISHFFSTQTSSKIHYTQTGNPSDSLLICLHGLGGSTETFTPLLPHLKETKRFNIITIDFPGFGKSPFKPLPIAQHVANLDNLIASLRRSSNATPVIILGHSFGSVIALHYAALKPNNVAGLALLGVGRSASHIPAARERMLDMAKRVRIEGIQFAAELAMKTNFAASEDIPQEKREVVRKTVARSDPEAYAQTCELMVSPGHRDPGYSAIKCPAVFVSGEGDMISPPERAKEMSGLLGGEAGVFIVRGGHQPILSDLEGTTAAISKLFGMIGQ